MDNLPAAAKRVADHVAALGLDARIVAMPASTRTAEEAAEACGCDVGQIIKSMIFQGKQSETPYLILVSGQNQVNEKAMARIIGEKIRRPDAAYVREVTGFAIGGIPPLGHKEKLQTYLDEDLTVYETAWGAAGTPDWSARAGRTGKNRRSADIRCSWPYR